MSKSSRVIATDNTLSEAFQGRCVERARLVRDGAISRQKAVDGLQNFALATDLVDAIGQDAVQAIIARAFEFQQPARPMDALASRNLVIGDAPAPRSLAEYGLSPHPVLEEIAEYATASPTRDRFKFTRFQKILLSTTARYLVKGIIPNEGLVVVWGPPKCGKSFLVFDLVAHIAAGWEYRGNKVKQSPVIYFALEGQEGFVARVEAFRRAHSISDIEFFLSADRLELPNDGKAVVQSITNQFPGICPGVVVLDTLNRSIGGSENDATDMGQYIRAADMIRSAFNCVVIVIHHCGVEGSRPRGHTSLTGAADAQIAVKRDGKDNVVATVEFMKDGPEGAKIISSLEKVVVGIDDDGEEITSCVIRPAELFFSGAKGKVTGQAAIALGILTDALETGGKISTVPQIPAGTRTILNSTWRTDCYAKMFAEDVDQASKQKAFVRAAKALQEKQLIGKCGDLVWIA
ncbi:AAA family ATPase [Bradyrhizobium sp. ma5]|uniref:AAA family ATPase n=1 Tax=Bradyrhizobium sp. ma5 TaxID=3344828 RepID=UPI0035D443C4